jgi:aminoglycoside phosphotransferase (APT) family kinase protein
VALVSGQRLGPYEIVSAIGSGGMGAVYRARDPRLGRDVAIKVISPTAGPIDEMVARFEREARAVAALNHPNILALHDIGNEDGVIYAVMELLEGETLRQRLASGRLAAVKIIDYAIQILRGLAAAHERGIVHRDLKPENLFITRDGHVKILDFGLAQHESAENGTFDNRATKFTTGRGVVVGTPAYMAPEQLVGEAATVRSDLFSFGVIVYEMLTGSHPFVRSTVSETAIAILREDPQSPIQASAGVPVVVARMLERCVEKRAADRPASARDLALFLEAARASDDPVAPAARVDADELRRLRLRVLVISCSLFALLAAATAFTVRTMANNTVTAAIEADLARATRLVARVDRERLTAAVQTARLVASFPELKALFATDVPTIRDYLLSYLQRNPEVPLLIALGPDGQIIARTDDVAPADVQDWQLAALAVKTGTAAIVDIHGRPAHAAAAVSDAGATVFGYVVAATPIDATFAAALRDVTQDDVVLLTGSAVVASTLRAGQTPWTSRAEWRAAGGNTDRAIDVPIGTQRFVAREVVLAETPALSVVVLKSRDDLVAPFRRIETATVMVSAIAALIAAIGSFLLARVVGSAMRVNP